MAIAMIESDKINTIHEGDITAYGAIPGADCTEILQWCFDNLRRIYIPKGNFIISNTIYMNTPGIILEGLDFYNSALKFTGTTDAFVVDDNVEFVIVRNLSIVGNYSKGKSEESSIKRCFALGLNSVMWKFENLFISGFYSYMIDGGSSGHVNNIHIEGCEFRTGHKSAIHLIAKNGWQINGIYINNNNNITGFEGNGLELWGNNIVVENNTIQACDNFAISLNSLEDANVNLHCRGMNICKNYYELCYKGFLDIAECYGDGADEYALIGGYKYVWGLNINGNFGDQVYPIGATQEQKDALDLYGIINFRSNNKKMSPAYGITYENNAFGKASLTKYYVNTHKLLNSGLTAALASHKFHFILNDDYNIDTKYKFMDISPASYYDKLIPVNLTYDGANDAYRQSIITLGAKNYIYFQKDDFNLNDTQIELYFKTNAIQTVQLVCEFAYKTLESSENYNNYTTMGGSTESYTQIEGDTPVFHKMTVLLNIKNNGVSDIYIDAAKLKIRLGLDISLSSGTTYFEVKDVKIKSVR